MWEGNDDGVDDGVNVVTDNDVVIDTDTDINIVVTVVIDVSLLIKN